MATATDDHHEVHDPTLPGSPSRDPKFGGEARLRRSAAEDCAVVDVDAVAEGLGLDSAYAPWLRALDAVEPQASFALPSRGQAEALLIRLAVPDDDLEAVLSVWPEPDRDVELWWLLERCHARFVASMGDGDAFIDCPSLPRELDLEGRCFWVFAYAVDGRGHPRVPRCAGRARTTSPGRRSPIWASRWSSTGSAAARRASTSSGGSSRTSWVRSTRSAACSSTCTTCASGSPGPRSGPTPTSPASGRATRRSACTSPRPVRSCRVSVMRRSTSRGRSWSATFPSTTSASRPARRGFSTSSSPTTCPPTRTSCGSNAASPWSTARPTMVATPCASSSIGCRSRSTTFRSARRSSAPSSSHLRGGGQWQTRTGWLVP